MQERDAATRFFSSEIGQTFEKEMREEPGDTKSSKVHSSNGSSVD